MVALLLASAIMSSPSEIQFKAMTYNIRYGTAKDGDNAWPHRRGALIGVIREHAPDVLGLQEALKFQLDEINSALPGYTTIGVGRDDGKERGEYAALLVKTEKFQVLDKGWFWLSDTPEKVASRTWGNNVTRICTWAKLKLGDHTFTAVSTHWDHESQEAREKSAKLILDRIQDRPMILMADFNAGLTNPAITTLGEHLRDSWSIKNPGSLEPLTFNGFRKNSPEHGEKIDGIWVSAEWDVAAAGIDRREGGASYPSDHFPVWAKLVTGNIVRYEL